MRFWGILFHSRSSSDQSGLLDWAGLGFSSLCYCYFRFRVWFLFFFFLLPFNYFGFSSLGEESPQTSSSPSQEQRGQISGESGGKPEGKMGVVKESPKEGEKKEGSGEMYILCRSRGGKSIRSLRIRVAKGTCWATYTKEGVDQILAKSTSLSICEEALTRLRRKLEEGDQWSCKEIGSSRIHFSRNFSSGSTNASASPSIAPPGEKTGVLEGSPSLSPSKSSGSLTGNSARDPVKGEGH